tara:strand:- start:327 stop:608 length:282 start_codon:yes stop_codon:yes gene_type:complete
MSEVPLAISNRGDVDWLCLNRPEVSNSLNGTLTNSLYSYFNELLQATRMGLNLTKEALNFGVDAPLLEAAMAQDALEAISAFNEDRSPKFKDK